jgi:ATP adenylyltransferase
MSDHARFGCLICAKHRGEGPLIGGVMVWEDEHSLVFHRPPGETGTTVLGYLFVESRRHVPYLADLTDGEAAGIGRTVKRAALGLRTELNADFVFSAVAGMSHAHFHQHVFARHPGTPAEYGWMKGDQWPDAPRGQTSAIVELCERLRPYLETTVS